MTKHFILESVVIPWGSISSSSTKSQVYKVRKCSTLWRLYQTLRTYCMRMTAEQFSVGRYRRSFFSFSILRPELWKESWLDGFREWGSGNLEKNDGWSEQLGRGGTSAQVFDDSQEVRLIWKLSSHSVQFDEHFPEHWWAANANELCKWSDFLENGSIFYFFFWNGQVLYSSIANILADLDAFVCKMNKCPAKCGREIHYIKMTLDL